MRKDYMANTASDESETAFVERYWTQVWDREAGPKRTLSKIATRDEYRIMRPWLDRLGANSRLLDAGCGLGDWTLFLSQAGFPTTGLDLSRATVLQLQARFPEASFAVGDIRQTGLESGTFDGIFSWGVFEHFENGPQDCIREAMRLLRPGGMLFISVPMDNLRHAVKATCAGPGAGQPEAPGSLRFYQWRMTPAELSRELRIGGFEVLNCHPIHKRQGVLRSLHHEFGLPYHWLLTKALAAGMAYVLPASIFAHVCLAVARRPAAD